ncbi:hypothetical protein WAI453_003572 [Rhynchosporium graminicola]
MEKLLSSIGNPKVIHSSNSHMSACGLRDGANSLTDEDGRTVAVTRSAQPDFKFSVGTECPVRYPAQKFTPTNHAKGDEFRAGLSSSISPDVKNTKSTDTNGFEERSNFRRQKLHIRKHRPHIAKKYVRLCNYILQQGSADLFASGYNHEIFLKSKYLMHDQQMEKYFDFEGYFTQNSSPKVINKSSAEQNHSCSATGRGQLDRNLELEIDLYINSITESSQAFEHGNTFREVHEWRS